MTPAYNVWATRFAEREEPIVGVREAEHRDNMNDAQRDSYEWMGRALQNNTVQVQEYRNDVKEIPNQIAEVMIRALRAQQEMIRNEVMNWMADRPLQTTAAQPPPQVPQVPTQQPAPAQAQQTQIRRQGEATVAAALGTIIPQANPLHATVYSVKQLGVSFLCRWQRRWSSCLKSI
jgi:hypothetical protein